MKILRFGIWLFAFGITISAQNATLGGSVTDENGAFIPDTKIEVLGESGRLYQASTNYEGVYRIEVPSGLYKITV